MPPLGLTGDGGGPMGAADLQDRGVTPSEQDNEKVVEVAACVEWWGGGSEIRVPSSVPLTLMTCATVPLASP